MARSLGDNIKAVFVTLTKNLGLQAVPVTERVDNARMSQTRLKALEKPAANPRRSLVGLPAANSPDDAILKINSIASMSHYRLSAYAATLPPDSTETRAAEKKIETEIGDDEFLDPKERRARELAAKYCR